MTHTDEQSHCIADTACCLETVETGCCLPACMPACLSLSVCVSACLSSLSALTPACQQQLGVQFAAIVIVGLSVKHMCGVTCLTNRTETGFRIP